MIVVHFITTDVEFPTAVFTCHKNPTSRIPRADTLNKESYGLDANAL
jgi:hypothetical protein